MHILPIISRSKGNQTMTFQQLINITWAIFFFRNHTQNVVEKLVTEPFLKNYVYSYLWINSLKFNTVCFDCMPSWELSKYVKTKLQTFFLPHFKLFSKIKIGLELVSLAHFLYNFWRKIFLLLYSIKRLSFIVWLP